MRPLRTARHSDRPSRPGIITSSTSRSKRSASVALERRLAVADAFARVALEAEMQAHELADVRLVLDDQHARRRVGHSFFTVRPSPRSPRSRPIIQKETRHDCNRQDDMTHSALGAGAASRIGARRRRVRARSGSEYESAAAAVYAGGRTGPADRAGRSAARADRWACCRCSAVELEPDRRAARSDQGDRRLAQGRVEGARRPRARGAHMALERRRHRRHVRRSGDPPEERRGRRRSTPTWRSRARTRTPRCCRSSRADQKAQLEGDAGGR